ncbi:MAG: hypothetical protein A2046_11160 [Bacteroidetes bacterium GWA2_30_7]|nr:MAG: hypothetical protein A2046_11160 [Bacteroidetes bacterium GWA2_30_7]
MDPAITGISRRTINNIIKVWQESSNAFPVISPDISDEEKLIVIQLIDDCIKEEGGEISRRTKVVHLAMIYINLNKSGKEKFLKILAHEFDVDILSLDEKIHNLQAAKNDEEKIKSELLLRDALIPPRVLFLRQLITLPNGFIFLKDMRCDLLTMIKSAPRLKKLSDDIKMLLVTYFDVNLLDLKEVTWESPASMLEKLMEYEAVHEINSWKELKHRLFTDHRVFAFFHNRMCNDPLIFVEVALVKGMSDNIQKLIDVNVKPGNPYEADTAIFYSISSTQKGLEGISFGNFLIKRVVKKLTAQFENIKTFATLSPVPMFRNWLGNYIKNNGNCFFKSDEEKNIIKISKNKNASEGLLEILNFENWYDDSNIADKIKFPLMRLCAHYLFNVKRNDDPNRALDPVANFHLSNGAKIEHIHWLADISKRGMKQSAGIMLNYHYRLDKIAINHENYMTKGNLHASSAAKAWLS